MRQASSKKKIFFRRNCIFSHIDGRQIEKLAQNLDKMCTHESNLSFERLKLELKLENWLKTEKIEIWGDAYLSLSRAEIFKLKFFHGNGLHLGERVLEILHLEAKIKPCRFSYPKITRFENGIILLKIDLKWPQNG